MGTVVCVICRQTCYRYLVFTEKLFALFVFYINLIEGEGRTGGRAGPGGRGREGLEQGRECGSRGKGEGRTGAREGEWAQGEDGSRAPGEGEWAIVIINVFSLSHLC